MSDLVVGPLSAFASSALWRPQPDDPRLTTVNARLLLHRSAVLSDSDDDPILRAAAVSRLGQRNTKLLKAVATRRAAAMRALGNVRTLVLRIEGAVVTGTGAGAIRDVGIELHGTYGWPILPGSSLKGVAREYARQIGTPHTEIFGSAPEEEPQLPGSVTFFDALPSAEGVEVAVHTMTPHTRGYRSAVDVSQGPAAPGEHVSPIPINFLVAVGGSFVAHLGGPPGDVEIAAGLLRDAVDDLGVGAKTAAGYGYLREQS
ncbi:type III-B CRISPR module RAMP protein Cmr6 [Microbispora bryophytorum]|uniref:type III-B CRISPR module RAMP protein Cmr6 n=1 Tax=Microbispora bryophytorum TaxID=1460882 RepID=UPI0033E40D2F